MPTLKANIGGVWTTIGTPIFGEVWVGPDTPLDATAELWVDTDDPGGPGGPLAMYEAAAYTPTLTGLAIGTGGSAGNVAAYSWVGGANVGDPGVLSVAGLITLGTSGQSVTGPVKLTLPPGFQFERGGSNSLSVGQAFFQAAGGFFTGTIHCSVVTELRLWAENVGSTYATFAELAAAIPATWAAGNSINWQAVNRAKRV